MYIYLKVCNWRFCDIWIKFEGDWGEREKERDSGKERAKEMLIFLNKVFWIEEF